MIDSNAKLRSIQMPFCSSERIAVLALESLFFLPKSFLNKLVIPTLPFSANTLAELLTFKFCQTCVYPNLTSGLIMKNCQNKIVMSIY